MYERFFGLSDPPFSLTPDPRLMWPSETHEEGLAVLVYGITRRKGFLLLTGEVGAGKTTLLRAALEALPDDVEAALILNTSGLTARDLLRMIVREFEIPGNPESKLDCLYAIKDFLVERNRAGRNTVLIIDEAQNLKSSQLEEVRLLSNFETSSEKLLQIVLTGQPELRKKLAAPELLPLRQRMALEHHVEPLRPEEVHPYLDHRIRMAGGSFAEVFASGIEPAFHEFSAGCPRLMNVLADRSMLSAFARQLRPVPLELVREKAARLLAARSEAAV